MKKKAIWVLVSCLMVAALVLASCAPAAPPAAEKPTPPTTEKPATPTEKPKPSEEEEEKVAPAPEGPGYGGVFIEGWATDTLFFDDTFGHPIYASTVFLTNDTLLQGDWAKGQAGTGEFSWIFYILPPKSGQAGGLAESWELTDPNTIVYQIRKGVHFHNKPPASGREMTADDVAFSLNRQWESGTSIFPGNPYIQSITAPDKWTVIVKADPGKMGVIYRFASWYAHIYPREAIEQYGDMQDWVNACGTGAFLLTDYVAGSSATFERNPNYWDNDPLHPENPIPYLDGVKYLVVPDVSTRLAALRTGKIDLFPGTSWEDAASLMQTNPQLKYKGYPGNPDALMWRVDKPELPFYDIRVRQALQLAVDNEVIARDFYGGNADVLGWPAARIPEFKDCYISLEELPQSVRELYEYHPDKAKQLLTEAGYPDGFRTEILCYKDQVDILSVVASYWADVGVELELDVKEYGAYQAGQHGKTYEEIYMGYISTAVPDQYPFARVGNISNQSLVNDPRIEEAYASILENYFNSAKVMQILKETNPYYIAQSYHLVLPAPYYFTFWQPWVKNYDGEIYVGTWSMSYNFVKWIWIDQDLKEEMTGRR